jgi:hypothetical protein
LFHVAAPIVNRSRNHFVGRNDAVVTIHCVVIIPHNSNNSMFLKF